MTIAHAFPVAPRNRPRRSKLDRCLVLLVVMAGLMLGGIGGPLAMLSAVSIIGIPLAAMMFLSVPIVAAVLPMRLSYLLLRRNMPWVCALALSACVSLISFTGLDMALKRGADGRHAAASIIGHDGLLLGVTHPDDGVIGLYAQGAPVACYGPCRTLLRTGHARAVIVLSDPTTPALRITRAPVSGICPTPTQAIPNTSGPALCTMQATPALPMLSYRLTQIETAPDMNALRGIWRITVRSGAMSHSVHLVEALVPQGGGLLSTNTSGTWGQRLSYRPRTMIQSVATFDLDHLPARAANPAVGAVPDGFTAAILETLTAR